MSIYFDLLPRELLSEIFIHLDGLNLLNVHKLEDILLKDTLESPFFWNTKYNLDFSKISWQAFISPSMYNFLRSIGKKSFHSIIAEHLKLYKKFASGESYASMQSTSSNSLKKGYHYRFFPFQIDFTILTLEYTNKVAQEVEEEILKAYILNTITFVLTQREGKFYIEFDSIQYEVSLTDVLNIYTSLG